MRNVTVITGTRAEYGLLKPLITALSDDSEFNLQLIVTGMHLSQDFGCTYKQIEADGFKIDKKVYDNLIGDTASDITKAIGTAMNGLADAFEDLNPDLVVILGDRSEILAAATAAMIKGLPIAHIHGGETTEGAYDEGIRHAITKMSYLHFTSAEPYRKRVIQLGETPNRVFNVGAIGIDSIKNLKLLSKIEFEKSISFKLNKKNILITFHPVTLEKATAKTQFNELLKSLDAIEEATLIFTKPNSDKDGRVIIEMIDDYVTRNRDKAIAFISLGQLRYLSALQYMDVVVGNSSSGVYEVPIFKKPTINIGDRQKGRLMPRSVINCEPNKIDINEALIKAFDLDFVSSLKKQVNIYGDGTATKKILDILKTTKIKSTKKTFYDL
ncbi:UDP-N-acetylglucosamine 2-epimerase [Cellulophaga baltica]|uniref:UDP-N-acetylglucosamine 2-epimerase n=1 Tax=Cellulophaga baltica TaxID=76594 RepID=UPI002494C796|nr:UDP-N-acetylglucosamine 2-epimerase [Cellulophaga baltica]